MQPAQPAAKSARSIAPQRTAHNRLDSASEQQGAGSTSHHHQIIRHHTHTRHQSALGYRYHLRQGAKPRPAEVWRSYGNGGGMRGSPARGGLLRSTRVCIVRGAGGALTPVVRMVRGARRGTVRSVLSTCIYTGGGGWVGRQAARTSSTLHPPPRRPIGPHGARNPAAPKSAVGCAACVPHNPKQLSRLHL
jgi:hypothetical protein